MDSISESAGAGPDLKRARRRRGHQLDASRADRLPPHSTEMEQGVLGCVLLSPNDCLAQCIEKLRSGTEVFYDLRHQTIYTELIAMHHESIPVDAITLQQRLKDKQLLDQIGGIPYLNSLQDAVPSAANLSYYLDIIHEKYVLRKVIQTCTDVVGRVYDYEGEVDLLMDEIEREMLSIRQFESRQKGVGVRELVHEAMASIEDISQNKGAIGGLSTGFPDLDKYTDGLHGGDMIVIAAFPSVGKTSLTMNIAEHVLLQQHKPVGVFSLEMTAVQLVTRFLCSHARVNLHNVRDGFLAESDFPKLVGAAGRISNSAIHFDDTSDLSIYELRARARRMHQEHKIELFVVDYLQLLNARGGSRKVENRQQEVADISNGIKSMAKELNVPVLALSQLNDDGQLRESRAIGMDADGLWKLKRLKKSDQEDDDSEDNEDAEAVDLWIRKNRNGPRDVCVHLTFLKSFTRFESAAKVSDDDIPSE